MNGKTKTISIATMLALVIIIGAFSVASLTRAATMTREQVDAAVKAGIEALLTGKKADADQQAKVKAINGMIKNGEISKVEAQGMVKKRLSEGLEKHKVSRYMIGKALDNASKTLPVTSGDDLHKMMWAKISSMLDKPLELKIGTLAPEGTAWLEYPKNNLNPHLKQISGGKIILKMYTGGVMGEDVDILRKMDMGQLDGCGCTALGVFKAAPEAAVFSLPRLFRNYSEVDHILKKFRKEIDGEFEKRGYLLAGLIDTGFFYLWTKEKVATLDDIRRQKLMTWFGTVETTTYDELGIKPTPVSVPEIVTSLNTGLVNATNGPAPWILGTQAYTNIKYYVKQPWFYSPAAIIFSKKIQDRFKGKFSDTLINNFTELMVYETNSMEDDWIKNYLRPYEKKCITAFETKAGIKPVTLGAADMKTIGDAAVRVRNKLAGKIYSKELLDKVVAELDRIRK